MTLGLLEKSVSWLNMKKYLKNKKISKEIYIQAKEYGFSDEKILQISIDVQNQFLI